MAGEKMVSSSFGVVVSPGLQTPGAGASKPWAPAHQVGLPWTLGSDPHA